MSVSFIYHHVALYRLAMGLLYRGRYRERFSEVACLMREADRRVLELCFGDVFLAETCKKRGVNWVGFDASPAFVANAVARGYDARQMDLLGSDPLPSCDLCVMMGSLYHFESCLDELFKRIKKSSRRFVLSEPVQNWTCHGGLRRRLALAMTRVAQREQPFRFNEATLLQTLDRLSKEVGFDYRVVSVSRDMIVEVVWSI